MAFVDELEITAKAGNGGDGVVRWRREKFQPKGGPAGGNGGRGGNIFMIAVAEVNRLSKYTGVKEFTAASGEDGGKSSKYGRAGDDLYIEVPVGSVVEDLDRGRVFEFTEVGQTEKVLRGGNGGLGNEYFKSSTNTAPEQSSKGTPGEAGRFAITVSLAVDVGFVGLPNAGKSTLLNTLTNAQSAIGSYAFTTTEPHLGAFGTYLLADIPGLIEGASEGRGLGHKFLRHIHRTKMILHLVSLASENPVSDYYTIRDELSKHSEDLANKEEWIVFTKKDLVNKEDTESIRKEIDNTDKRVFFISCETGEGVEELTSALRVELAD